MTLARFVSKNVFRNKRRSTLTALSIGFSLLLLTLMMTIWRTFYIDEGSAESAQRIIVRNKVSLVFNVPEHYREKIRSLNGVKNVVPQQWFGGTYKDPNKDKQFAQFATDPEEFFEVYRDFHIAPEQLDAWKKDRAGCVVDSELANEHGWKIGDRIFLKGTIFPTDVELTVRGIYTAPANTLSLYFNRKYLEEAYTPLKGGVGFYGVLADSAQNVPVVAKEIDEAFRNADRATKSESEKAFGLGWIAMLGNVKAFILSICGAVVFATLLVSANTIAMSIRERTREVAVLKTLGFTQRTVLGLFVGEAIGIALVGGLLGTLATPALIWVMAQSPQGGFFFSNIKMTFTIAAIAMTAAAIVGFLSAFVPAYNASRGNIVDGLRHIG
ncbi:MAG TPA: FtsX-like permease family protein [Terriglobales bacterium]|jgi:putative ABC transport system permease protein